MKDSGIHGKAVKAIWKYVRGHGYVCYYTKMALDLNNTESPWYCVFDHWMPGDGRKVVITSNLINERKSDMSEKEFWYYIEALDNYKRTHRPIKKKPLVYWDRLMPPVLEGIPGRPASGKTFRKCCICGRPVHSPSARYCLICAAFGLRLRTKQFPRSTVQAIWDFIRHNGYVCYYTKMPLDLKDQKSPWYCVFDHWIPADPAKVVLTSALFNDMKSDLSEKEFWYFIGQLAKYRRTGTKVRKRKIVYWERYVR